MLQKLSLLLVCAVMAITVGLVISPTATPSVNHDFVEINPNGNLELNEGLGAFTVQVMEFRELRKDDRAVSITDEPVYFVKLRLIKKDVRINPDQTHDEFIQLAVSSQEHYLNDLTNRKAVTIMYQVTGGKLTTIYYLGC